MGSAPLPLQRGRDTLKISPRQLIREKQAVAAEMFVVVLLLWLPPAAHNALGERAWTRLSALINSSALPLKHSLAEAPKSFPHADLMEPSGHMQERDLQTHGRDAGLTGTNWRTG